jgi:CubicO group peptidase (beta-lactamase class C family)
MDISRGVGGWFRCVEFSPILGGMANFKILAAAAAAAVAGACGAFAAAPAQTRCAALGLTSCPDPYDAHVPDPKDMLIWTQPERVIGFRNTWRMYGGDVFHAGSAPYPLPAARGSLPAIGYRLAGRHYDLKDYVRRQSVTGLLILKDGAVAYEYYGGGNTDKTLWTSRSVAKSVVSILIGIAIGEGAIKSVDDPIVSYLPELRGGAWSEVTLRQLLQHTSGVAWNENYADPGSDFARLTHCEAEQAPYDCVFDLIRSVKRRAGVNPGEVWSYNTGGAWLAGRVLERATGMPLAKYLQTRVWSRFAMESDGVWEALDPGRVDMGGHGFNATLRDWGRFALFVARDGTLPSGERLLPSNWIRDSTTWTRAQGSVTPSAPDGQYGYQWWFLDASPAEHGRATATAKQSFWAEGIYGQGIAIDPSRGLILVQWSTWKNAEAPDSFYDEQAVFFDALARSL